MLGLGKYSKSWFYIEYSTYTHKLFLLILFRNCMSDATDNKSFGLGLTDINKASKHIVYIDYEIIAFF